MEQFFPTKNRRGKVPLLQVMKSSRYGQMHSIGNIPKQYLWIMVLLFAIMASSFAFYKIGWALKSDPSAANPRQPKPAPPDQNTLVKDATRTLDNYYRTYLTGSAEQAIQSREEAIKVEQDPALPILVRTHGTWLDYCRMYAIESRTGRKEEAEIAFTEASKWYVLREEALGLSADKARDASLSFTREKCVNYVDDWDRHYAPNGPAYMRALPTTQR
jgi:hypothetical protein